MHNMAFKLNDQVKMLMFGSISLTISRVLAAL